MLELPIILSMVTAVVAATLGMRYGRTLHNRGVALTGHLRVRDLPLIPVSLLIVVAVHILTATLTGTPRFGWALPIFFEYYLIPVLWVMKLFFAAFAMAAIVMVGWIQQHKYRLGLLLFSMIAIMVIDTLTRRSVQPNLGAVEDKRLNGVILQTNPSTCAAASAANIARRFGMDLTEADMVKRLNTTWAGTSPAQIVYGFRSLGLEARKVAIADCNLDRVQPPEPDAHAVAYMAKRSEGYEIWDPNSGKLLLNDTQIRLRWQGRGVEVQLGKSAD